MMRSVMLVLCATATVALFSCGGSTSTSSNSQLTSTEINAINNTLMSAMNNAGTTSTGSGAVDFMRAAPREAVTFSQTCNNSNYQFTASVNDSQTCPTAGHITYTGNLKTSCSSWMYYTSPATYCNCTGDWYISNSLTFQYGDRTNNLNDCETSGVILDGTVYANVAGKVDDFNISINGSLSVNRRGSTGGLVPLDSCYINLLYKSSTGKWSGSICGSSVS